MGKQRNHRKKHYHGRRYEAKEIICGLPSDLWEFEILSFLNLFTILPMMRINKQFYKFINHLDDLEFWRDVQFKNLENWALSVKKDSFIYENFMKTNEKILEEMKRLKFKQIVVNLYTSFWIEVKDYDKYIKTYLNSSCYKEVAYSQPVKELSFHMVRPNRDKNLELITNWFEGGINIGYAEHHNVDIGITETIPIVRTFHGIIQVFTAGFAYKTNTPSQTHTICGFNRFDRKSWEYLRKNLMEYVNQPYPVILIGLNWYYCPATDNVDNSGYVNFTEIINFCSKNQISAYVDGKITCSADAEELFKHVMRVSLLDFGFDELKLDLKNPLKF